MKLFTKILLAFSWAIFIFILLDFPLKETATAGIPFFDKGAHFFIFGVLAFLIISVLEENKKLKFNYIRAFSFLLSIFYSGFTEYFQKYVPGRNPSFWDFLAGLAGVAFIIFIFSKKCYNKEAEEVESL